MDEFDRWPDIIEASQKRGPIGPWAEPGKRLVKEWEHLLDIPWVEGTDQYSHEYTVRVGALSVMKGRFSYGRCKLSGADLRRQLFYGDPYANVYDMTGFSRCYESSDTTKVQNGRNVIDAGGDGGSSLWFVTWDPRFMAVRYPLHSEGGLDADADRIQAALAVTDWRYAVRIANVRRLSDADLGAHVATAISLLAKVNEHTVVYAPPSIASAFSAGVFHNYPVRAIPELRTDEPRVV